MEQAQDTGSFVKKVVVEYENGRTETIEGFVMIVTDNHENQKWKIGISESAELDQILEFAYDAVDMLENQKIVNPQSSKKSHLTLVKG